MKIGSDEHKELFCRSFVASHDPYEPERLPWPELDEASLARIRGVPFWEEVYYAERRAGALIAAYAPSIDDPLVREAVDLQGFEEARHARLIGHLIERYGLTAREQPLTKFPDDIETAFVDFGYGECVDAFFGFGAYQFARRSGFLPESMFSVLDVLMLEETRHIVFFVNWMAWREVRRGRGAPALRGLTSAWFHGRAVGRHLKTIRKGKPGGEHNFSATQADVFKDGFSVRGLMGECLSENERRMRAFDSRLLRPRLMPGLTAVALSVMKLWPAGQPKPKAA
jgi:hypothetical protein